MRDERQRRELERNLHSRLYGPSALGPIPWYCESHAATAAAVKDAAVKCGVAEIAEQMGPSNGERYNATLIVDGQRFPGSGSSDIEARVDALATLLGLFKRPTAEETA